jgi:amidohydrolase
MKKQVKECTDKPHKIEESRENMLENIVKKAEEIRDRIIKFRREIHMNPELGGSEEKTAAFVAGILEDNDIEVKRGVAGWGVVGLLKGGDGSGDTVALRGDMDALPIQDYKKVEYASSVPGIMHACGHDVHSAVLMGTAIVLGSLRERLAGNVKFIFQPSEERPTGGADYMIKAGVLEDPAPSAIFALHTFPEMQVGTIGHKAGIMTASADRFRIVIKGKSGHASRPHQTVDAVLVSSMVISAIHHIVSRRTDPIHPAVISVGTIEGGSAPNVIAEVVEMRGTVRTLSPKTKKIMPPLIEKIIRGTTITMGATYEFLYEPGSPSVVNDWALNQLVKKCAVDVVSAQNVVELPDPMMGAEDFAYYTEKIPGMFIRLGTSNREKGLMTPLHSSYFDVDEDALAVGTKVMSWIAVNYLNKSVRT